MTRKQLRIVFFGDSSSRFSVTLFQPLRKLVEKKPSEYRLVGVVDTPKEGWTSTNPDIIPDDQSFITAAEKMGIPVLSPSEEKLSVLQAHLFVAVGYTKLLTETVLNMPFQGTVNFHASLLPAYRGKHPVFRALQAGENTAGLSVHLMDTSLDTGPLLYQCRVAVKKKDSVSTLYQRILKKSVPLMRKLLKEAKKGTLTPFAQPVEGASYFSSLTDSDFQIRFQRPAVVLQRHIYASPGKCYFTREGRKVFLWQVNASSKKSVPPWGRVISCRGKNIRIAVPGGSLVIGEVQEEEKEKESGNAFLERNKIPCGMRLEGESNG